MSQRLLTFLHPGLCSVFVQTQSLYVPRIPPLSRAVLGHAYFTPECLKVTPQPHPRTTSDTRRFSYSGLTPFLRRKEDRRLVTTLQSSTKQPPMQTHSAALWADGELPSSPGGFMARSCGERGPLRQDLMRLFSE